MKVYDRGKLRKDVWDFIFANIRFDIVQHDMKAEIGACRVGQRRMLSLQNTVVPVSEAHKQALFEATQRMMNEIAAIPDGIYHGEGRVLYDGGHGIDLHHAVTISVDGKRIKFDYSTTDRQTNGFVKRYLHLQRLGDHPDVAEMVECDIRTMKGWLRRLKS